MILTALPKISSPCIKVCILNADKNQCTGCGRTTEQIMDWMLYSEEKRLAIMVLCKQKNARSAE
jgi:predicted Fe-S protein YdhL (DUF1289 family)